MCENAAVKLKMLLFSEMMNVPSLVYVQNIQLEGIFILGSTDPFLTTRHIYTPYEKCP